MDRPERLRRYRADRDDPSIKDAVSNAYEIGYEEGGNSVWADITAYLDEWGDEAFLAWIKHGKESE